MYLFISLFYIKVNIFIIHITAQKTYLFNGDIVRRTKIFFINGAILTATALVMKSIGMAFNLYISNKIGSEAVGVFSLVMSVYMLFVTLATSGLGLACTCIVSEQFSKGNFFDGLKAVKSCLLFSLLLGLGSSFLVLIFSNLISQNWLKSVISCVPLYLISIGLPFIGISSVLNGYFSAVRKGYKSAFCQMSELLIKIVVTILFLNFSTNKDIETICICLILADVISEIFSCCLSYILYKRDSIKYCSRAVSIITFKKRILKIALPVSITSFIRSGLSTLKQFIIPNRLLLFGLTYSAALSEYGKINGMTMSVLLFPNVFIMSFSNLLIPEFASLFAQQYKKRILYICKKIFFTTSIFSIAVSMVFFFFADKISLMAFQNLECEKYIKILSPLILFMYTDNILDSMLKGLNKQFGVMVCNILDLILTIGILYFSLPILGITGYLLAILISEVFNFCISYFQLYKATSFKMPISITLCYLIFIFIGIYEVTSTL